MLKRSIVDKPARAFGSGEESPLVLCRISSDFEGAIDGIHDR
jgi:hypothetical protein